MSRLKAVVIRPANPETDFPRIAELLTQTEIESITAELVHEDENRQVAGKIRRRLVAVTDAQQIVGYAYTVHYPSQPTGLFHLVVAVEPGFRGLGAGAALYQEIAHFAQGQGATQLKAEVREHDPDSRRFAEARGFILDYYVFESALDLATFDESRFDGLIEAVEATGLRFFTLADEGNLPEAQRKLYEINRIAVLDDPSEGSIAAYEVWRKLIVEASWFKPEGQFIAADGDRYVGLAGAWYQGNPDAMEQGLTGVDRAYRGRKIAQALKLLTIRYAKACGATRLNTGNDSRNAPMLAINRKFGYQPQPGRYGMVKIVA